MEPRRPTYGRRRGHRLSARQSRLLKADLPRLSVPLEAPAALDPAVLFERPPRETWLEIGFGGGEHLIWQAARHPDVGILGAEPYINGVAKLLAALEDERLTNVRVHVGDARDLLDALRPGCLGRVFILFPDPWPKTRHHKRRIVNAETVAGLARVIAPGGILRLASDIAAYQCWMLEHLRREPAFEWTARSATDWRVRPPDWPPTRYEQKAISAGRRCAYLTFRRR